MRSFYIKSLSIVAIFCLGTAVYSNTFLCSFHFDDFYFISHNLRNLQSLPEIWHYFHGRFLIFLSLAFNYHLNGLNVLGYHLFNLTVHLVSAFFVWWLTLLTLSTPVMKDNKIAQHASTISLLSGLVFVSHPVQIEAVTNIWQRSASMAAMFYLASVCFYIKSRLSQNTKAYYICSLLTAVAAMFSKENTVTLPLMILCYECAFLKTRQGLDWKYLSPFLLTIFIVPVTFLFDKTQVFQDMHGDLKGPDGIITPIHYFLTQFRVMLTYIRLVFLPINQNFDYDYPVFKNLFDLPVLISFLLLITIFYGGIRLYSKYRLVSFSIFWFFLTLMVPESSFWPMGDVILEHRLYLPLAGYSIFLVSGLYYLFPKNTIKTTLVVLLMIIAFNSILTYQRNKVWRSEFTLWDDTVHKSPHKARPYINRGTSYANQGYLIRAISDYNKALEIKPDSADAYYNLGNAYRDQRKFAQAIFDYNKAIEINPDNPVVYNDRGYVYFQQGRFIQAMSDFDKATKIDPDYAEVYNNRGLAYLNQGDLIQAISNYNKAIEINPDYAEVYNNRGFCYAMQGHFIQAVSDFDKAIELNPNYAKAYNDRAVTYYHLAEYDKAWSDAYMAERLGAAVSPEIISMLKKALGKNE